jgi:hypothetical protein
VTSTDPTGGASNWSTADADGTNSLVAISCPSSTLCVAVDESGDVLTSTNPAGGASAWTPAEVDTSGGQFWNVTCPSSSECVGVDDAGNIATSTNPTGGASAWTVTNVDGEDNVFGVSCPSTAFCVAGDDEGRILTSADPSGDAGEWPSTEVDPGTAIQRVACISTTLCVALDSAGNVLIGTPGGVTPVGGSSGGSGGGNTVDELVSLKLGSHKVRSGQPVKFEVKLRARATITIKILREIIPAAHGKHRPKPHYQLLAKLTFHGKAGLNTLKVSKLHKHTLAVGQYEAEVSAGSQPVPITFTIVS